MGPEEPQIPQAPQLPEQPQQPAPQPLPEPVQPVQPMQTQQSQFGGGLQQPVMPSPMPVGPVPKKSKKGLIIGLSAAAAVIFIGLVGLVLWLTVFSISSADYKKAQTAVGDVETAYNTVKNDFSQYVTDNIAGSSDASGITAEKDTLDKSFSDLKTKFDGLKNLKAFSDSDLKKKYDAFVSDYQKVAATIDDFMSSHDLLSSVADTCSSSGKSIDTSNKAAFVSAYDAVLAPCIKDLKDLSSAKQSDLAAYGKNMYDLYQEQRSIIQDLQDAYNAKDASKYSDAQTRLSTQLNKFTNSNGSKDLISALKDKSQGADGSLAALVSEVQTKSSK